MPSAAIQERGTVSGNQMRMSRPIEDAGQSFKPGTPLIFNSANGAVTTPTTTTTPTAALLISLVGIAKEFGAGLLTAGVPAGTGPPLPTAPPIGTIPTQGGGPTYPPGTLATPGGGAVPNMPNAANLLRPVFNDGRTGVVLAIPDTVFYAQVGPQGTTVPSQLDIGKTYGLTLDTDGRWYVDRTKTATTNACLKIIGLDQWDTARGVLFTFLPSAAQLLA